MPDAPVGCEDMPVEDGELEGEVFSVAISLDHANKVLEA